MALASVSNKLVLNSAHTTATRNEVVNYLHENLPANFPPSFRNGLEKTLLTLPLPVTETFLVGSLINGLGQSLQEFLMQFLPKAGSGVVMRNTWLIAADEALVEFPQYLFAFILPTILAAILARPFAKMLDLPHFEILGTPLHELNKKLNQRHEVGTLQKREVLIDKKLIGKAAIGKLGLFAILATYSFATEVVVSALRVLGFHKLFKTSNFYTISGLTHDPDEIDEDGEEALKQAEKNVVNGLSLMALAVPVFMGLTWALSKNKNITGSKFVESMSKVFDLSGKFGLPKTLMAVSVLSAGLYAYPSVARNEAERLEVKHRVLYFAAPTLLFFKQIAGNLLGGLTGAYHGVGNVLAPGSSYFKEVGDGSRNIFDLGLIGLQKDKQGNFSGRITEMPSLKRLKEQDPGKYQKTLKSIHFMEHWAPYWMALFVGIGINWLNYLRTAQMHASESEDNSDDNKPNVFAFAKPATN